MTNMHQLGNGVCQDMCQKGARRDSRSQHRCATIMQPLFACIPKLV